MTKNRLQTCKKIRTEGNYRSIKTEESRSSGGKEGLLELSLTLSQKMTKNRLQTCKRIRMEGNCRRSTEIEENWSVGGKEKDYLNLI